MHPRVDKKLGDMGDPYNLCHGNNEFMTKRNPWTVLCTTSRLAVVLHPGCWKCWNSQPMLSDDHLLAKDQARHDKVMTTHRVKLCICIRQ